MVSSCPVNSFVFNTTQCSCNPGYYLNTTSNNCTLYEPPSTSLTFSSGVDYSLSFPETIFSFDSIKRFTRSEAVFLEATLVMLFSWLLFCFAIRFKKVGRGYGQSPWFKIRWWISRLDVCFSTRHWLYIFCFYFGVKPGFLFYLFSALMLTSCYSHITIFLAAKEFNLDDQKVVRKRKTELGGALSIASYILFIGLFAALVYQIISKRSIEVHNIRPSNAPDFASFRNDMEFNVTTISSMSCSNLRGLGTLNSGYPGTIDQRIAPLSSFANYSCYNSSMGPTVSLRCQNCQLILDILYISWWFVDLPNDPATAIGFQFNVTAQEHTNKKHLSFVSGVLSNGSNLDDRRVTFRGTGQNILKFNLFPRLYHNFHDLKLVQPLFHEFKPGSFFNDVTGLQASLQNSNDGIINTTVFVNFLSDYILEIDNQLIWDPVSFLADLGGLYCISIAIFFYILVQFEYRIKRFRNEDTILRKIRSQQKARQHWDKLRKYVMYTWGWGTVDENYRDSRKISCCSGMMVKSRKNGSSRNQQERYSKETISHNKKRSALSNKHEVRDSMENGKRYSTGSHEQGISLHAFSSADESVFPPPPALECKDRSEANLSEMQKNLKDLYDYNVLLREKLVDAGSMFHSLTAESSSTLKDASKPSKS